MTEVALRDKIPTASNSDLKQALQKVGDLNQSTAKWELRRPFYKELDVWSFDYATANDRQRAIDNAVKQYDKMRLGVSEPEWDRLLPFAERGTGKCLSKLQVQIAQGTAARAPKSSAQKAEGSSRDGSNGEEEGVSSDKNPASSKSEVTKSENTIRPVSRPTPAKAKKFAEKAEKAEKVEKVEKVVQTKKWMSARNAPKAKSNAVKKERPNAKQGKVLSSEYVQESDDDEDEDMAPVNPVPKSMKRSREDEEETSDSSIPLSKKIKEDHTHRTSDASQSSRTFATTSPNMNRAKGSSPPKSSPLSSPPTNASEFESSSGHNSSSASPAHHNVKGRRSPVYKRHQKSSSVTSSVSSNSSHRSLQPEVVDLARRYRSYYPKYEALHREVANSGGRRNLEREQELLEMHERLSDFKKQILAGIVYVEN
jgi:RNA polymerase II elongation factor ELL